MPTIADLILFALAGLVLVPLAVFTAEIALSLFVRRPIESSEPVPEGVPLTEGVPLAERVPLAEGVLLTERIPLAACPPVRSLTRSQECFGPTHWRTSRQWHPGRVAEFNRDGPRTVVLIPAHDEELVIEHTLRTLLSTLGPRDRVLVVADNCADATAAIARRCGADVVQRTDTTRRGKTYALEFGLRALAPRPPEVVVVLDADCEVGPATVTTISRLAAASGRPVQALNLSEAAPGDPSVQVVSEVGFRFKNLVRPLGLRALGLPCQLMGTGMALPWDLAGRLSHAGEHLVEDMHLGIDLALAGSPPLFFPDVRVTSRFPRQRSAWISQRTRWEQGHLRMLFRHGPRLLLAAVRRGRIDLLSLALDLCVPPLSLLVLIWLLATGTAATAWLCGASVWPLALLAAGGVATAFAVVAAWRVHCRERVPLAAIVSIPRYILRKLPIYAAFFLRRGARRWVRTHREAPPWLEQSAAETGEPAPIALPSAVTSSATVQQ